MAEQVERLFAYLLRIVPSLQHFVLVQCIPYAVKFPQQFMVVFGHLLLIVPFRKVGCLQHFKNEYGMMRSQGASALRYYVGMRNTVLIAGIHQSRYRVVHIFLNGVVHATLAIGRARSIIVHSQAAAYIHKFHFEAHAMQLHIELRRFTQGSFDTAYLRHLASDMEMYQFQTILHAFVSHEVECFEQLTGRQSELTCIAARVFPFAASRRSQLDTNTDIGFYVQLLRHLGYQLQFVQFFYHEEDAFSHLLRQQSKFNVAFILISVADNQRIGVHIDSNHCMQFRFGARFQSKIELLAMADNLLNHRTHLIHFNRIDDKVFRFITILLCRLPETTGNLFDPVVKDVGKANQHGSHHITQLQFVDQLFQINANSIFTRCYYNMTFVIDTKVRSAPTCNVVKLF